MSVQKKNYVDQKCEKNPSNNKKIKKKFENYECLEKITVDQKCEEKTNFFKRGPTYFLKYFSQVKLQLIMLTLYTADHQTHECLDKATQQQQRSQFHFPFSSKTFSFMTTFNDR